jgi:hypothetical protein
VRGRLGGWTSDADPHPNHNAHGRTDADAHGYAARNTHGRTDRNTDCDAYGR